MAPKPPSDPGSARTAHQCAYLGASLYASAFTVAFFATWLTDRALPYDNRTFTAQGALVILAGVLPPLALIGAGTGFRLYCRAIGETRARPASWSEAGYRIALVGTLVALGFIICLVIAEQSPLLALSIAGSWLVLWHWRCQMAGGLGFLVWASALAVYSLTTIDGRGEAATGLLSCALALLLAADALLLDAICHWQKRGRLAPAPAYTFQFSLRSLLTLVLGLGTYVSVLVMLADR